MVILSMPLSSNRPQEPLKMCVGFSLLYNFDSCFCPLLATLVISIESVLDFWNLCNYQETHNYDGSSPFLTSGIVCMVTRCNNLLQEMSHGTSCNDSLNQWQTFKILEINGKWVERSWVHTQLYNLSDNVPEFAVWLRKINFMWGRMYVYLMTTC